MDNNGNMPAMPVYVDESDWTLRWSKDTGTAKAGDVAGSDIGRGYRQLKFMGKVYMYHRVMFFVMNGYLPDVVDHIDGNPSNNAKSNLRAASKSQNMINRKVQSNNKSGKLGVDYMKRDGVWRAQIHKDGEKIYLGTYKTIFDAAAARIRAEKSIHGEYSRNKFHTNADALLAELEHNK